MKLRKKNIECEGPGGPIQNIQGFIQKALAIINFIKSQGNSFLTAASDLKDNIQNVRLNCSQRTTSTTTMGVALA